MHMAISSLNSRSRTSILCVDDCQHTLMLCRAVLELNGYHVWTAPGAGQALKTLEHHRVDGAIIDNEMPGMNGIQLAKTIKRRHPRLPVLMFSGSSSPEDLDSVDRFLPKGDGPWVLIDALHSLGLRTATRPSSQITICKIRLQTVDTRTIHGQS